ncbi:hypothetical protein BV22DRAFT_1037638 [Leucogyrophana mollusca]|uniref:Uncharacterized protein n=1 Tax=Leucogyrophana mollusca TaxID=85980 RepID=A0ACB8BAR1_9AGAM|nr:hypothetical protein BV22DRAFT_1037638 [Leucogyrophana mollusca]
MPPTRASKRLKTTAGTALSESEPQPEVTPSHSTTSNRATVLFEVYPALDRIPDDVLLEILSHLSTITEGHVLYCHYQAPPAVPVETRERTDVLRALSQTCKLLRTRCFPLAWRRFEVCTAPPSTSFYRVLGEAMKTKMSCLGEATHLLPLLQTVTVGLTRYQVADIIPAFARCLASMPNLHTVEVVHAHSQMTTALKQAFEGRTFPTVRKIVLPSCAHEILRCCSGVEDVACNEDSGSTIIGAIVKGNCTDVRKLIGISAPIKRLVKVIPNLRIISVANQVPAVEALSQFPKLEVIEVDLFMSTPVVRKDKSLALQAPKIIEAARNVLKGNQSTAEKTIRLRLTERRWYFKRSVAERDILEVVRV